MENYNFSYNPSRELNDVPKQMEMSPDMIRYNFESLGYIASDSIVDAVYSALATNSPILVDGPAGVGKTELAKVIATMQNANFIRLQCYDGIGPNEVLYDMDRNKMQSYTTMLVQHVKAMVHGKTWDEAIKTIKTQKFYESEEFLIKRPVLQSIAPNDDRYQVLLVDEIDKASDKIEALLLEVLSDFSVSVPELGRTYHCKENMKPIIIITSNNVRELGEPLRRRCTYIYIDYPSIEIEQKIISCNCKISMDYAYQAAVLMHDIRKKLQLKKKPCNSESIAFFKVLYYSLKVPIPDVKLYGKTMVHAVSLLAKYPSDIEMLTNYFLSHGNV